MFKTSGNNLIKTTPLQGRGAFLIAAHCCTIKIGFTFDANFSLFRYNNKNDIYNIWTTRRIGKRKGKR